MDDFPANQRALQKVIIDIHTPVRESLLAQQRAVQQTITAINEQNRMIRESLIIPRRQIQQIFLEINRQRQLVSITLQNFYESFLEIINQIRSMAALSFADMYRNHTTQFTGFLDVISEPDYLVDNAEVDSEDVISVSDSKINVRTKFTGSVRNVLSLNRIKDGAIKGMWRAYWSMNSEFGTTATHLLAAVSIEGVKVYSNLDPTSAMIVGGLGLIAGAPALMPIPSDAVKDNTMDK